MAAACATLLAIALLCPAIASAGRAPLVIPGSGIYAELGLKRSNGTSLVVFAHGTLVSVRLIEGSGIQAAGSEYSTRGRFTGDAVHADFGKLGLVAVTFKPTGRLQRSPQEGICKGKPRVTRRGFFTGTIRFRSDDGAINSPPDVRPASSPDLQKSFATADSAVREARHRVWTKSCSQSPIAMEPR